jgi:Holliday junction resolvase-like predicted endonuclease
MAIPLHDGWWQRLKRWIAPRLGNTDHVGRLAEDAACRLLRERGFTIRHRNARTPKGEADIIADSPAGVHVVVEVKSRVRKIDAPARSNATSPLASITHEKRERLQAMRGKLQQRCPRRRQEGYALCAWKSSRSSACHTVPAVNCPDSDS